MSISHWGIFPVVQSSHTGAFQSWPLNEWIETCDRYDAWLRAAYKSA